MKTASLKLAKAALEARPEESQQQQRPNQSLQMYLETICYKTRERLELINITRDVNEVVKKYGMKAGFVMVQSLHTTTAVFINEFQQALLDDIKNFLERLVGRIDYWRHNDPKLSECNRKNADSHLARHGPRPHALAPSPQRRGSPGLLAIRNSRRAGRPKRTLSPNSGPGRLRRKVAPASVPASGDCKSRQVQHTGAHHTARPHTIFKARLRPQSCPWRQMPAQRPALLTAIDLQFAPP